MIDQFQLRQSQRPAESTDAFNVLSLSGGGYRGLFTAQLIAAIEAADVSSDRGKSLGERFDLIVGTSIGGILGVALSCGAKGARLVDTLTSQGSGIFPSLRFRSVKRVFGKTPYSPDPLVKAICSMVPQARSQRFGQYKKAVMLTTVNWTSARLQLLGSQTTPYAAQLDISLLDAMLATSAAPAYFPAHRVGHETFIDGGVVANVPDLFALRCAQRMAPTRPINMLSIGTAGSVPGLDPSSLPNRAFLWAKPIIALTSEIQSAITINECQQLMGSNRYARINASLSSVQQPLVALDIANAKSTDILQSLADTAFATLTPSQKAVLNTIGFRFKA